MNRILRGEERTVEHVGWRVPVINDAKRRCCGSRGNLQCNTRHSVEEKCMSAFPAPNRLQNQPRTWLKNGGAGLAGSHFLGWNHYKVATPSTGKSCSILLHHRPQGASIPNVGVKVDRERPLSTTLWWQHWQVVTRARVGKKKETRGPGSGPSSGSRSKERGSPDPVDVPCIPWWHILAFPAFRAGCPDSRPSYYQGKTIVRIWWQGVIIIIFVAQRNTEKNA